MRNRHLFPCGRRGAGTVPATPTGNSLFIVRQAGRAGGARDAVAVDSNEGAPPLRPREFTLTYTHVTEALDWLIENNPLYAHIIRRRINPQEEADAEADQAKGHERQHSRAQMDRTVALNEDPPMPAAELGAQLATRDIVAAGSAAACESAQRLYFEFTTTGPPVSALSLEALQVRS